MNQTGPPPLALLAAEGSRATAELGLYLAARPVLAHAPRGDGHPVLVLPGLGAGDLSTRVLRRYLRTRGYYVHGWRLGRNVGPTQQISDGLTALLDRLTEQHGQAVSVVGWSLGGIYARLLAQQNPTQVRQVITLGSPFQLTAATPTRAKWLFNRYSHLHVTQPVSTDATYSQPLSVPATSVYSRTDGVVSWRSCLDVDGPRSENVEVIGSHCGLGHHPAVLWLVADRLAQPEGAWGRFTACSMAAPLFASRDGAHPNGDVAA